MNTGPSGVGLEQEVTQAEIIQQPATNEEIHTPSSVWAHGDNKSSVHPQTSYSRGMIIVFISRPLWFLSPPTMKSFFMAIFKVAGRLLSNTFHLRAHAAFYITSTSTKNIRRPSHDEAVMSTSFE